MRVHLRSQSPVPLKNHQVLFSGLKTGNLAHLTPIEAPNRERLRRTLWNTFSAVETFRLGGGQEVNTSVYSVILTPRRPKIAHTSGRRIAMTSGKWLEVVLKQQIPR